MARALKVLAGMIFIPLGLLVGTAMAARWMLLWTLRKFGLMILVIWILSKSWPMIASIDPRTILSAILGIATCGMAVKSIIIASVGVLAYWISRWFNPRRLLKNCHRPVGWTQPEWDKFLEGG